MNEDYAKIREMLLKVQIDTIVARGMATVPALIVCLKDMDRDVKWRSAWALGDIGDASAIPALLDALKDGDLDVRWWAATALGKIGDASAVPALIAVLKGSYASLRMRASDALVNIAEKTDVDLRAVQKALEEYVDLVKKEGNAAEARGAKNEGRVHYMRISAAARKHAAEKHALVGDGVILVGELPRPPSDGKKGMYRTGREARAMAQ